MGRTIVQILRRRKVTTSVVMVALTLGVVSSAFAANGGNFILGVLSNSATAMTRLTMTGTTSGSVLQLIQQSTGTGASGLGITVPAGKAPIKVNSTAGKATNLNADKLDGKDSSEFAAANDSKVGRLVLSEPPPNPTNPTAAPSITGTVLETDAFTIRGVCTNHPISTEPEVNLQLVPKQDARAIMVTPEGSSTPAEFFNRSAGQWVDFAHILVTGDFSNPDTFNTYGSYIADAPGGFLEGRGTAAVVREGPNPACSFSATGLGQ